MKAPKLRAAQLSALRQYRENLLGGDPDMSRVTRATVDVLVRHRLVAVCYYDEPYSQELVYTSARPAPAGPGKRVFERAMIPTRAGLDLLESLETVSRVQP